MASAPLFYDRVMETSTTTGTGTYTLAGAVTGYQAFSVVGNSNSCYYCAEEVDNNGAPSGGWEVGVGTYTASGGTLSRDTVLASSNAGSAVNWSSGTRRIMLVAPAAYQSGRVLLETHVASTSSSIDFTNRNASGQKGTTFQSDFDVYEFVLTNMVPASSGVNMTLVLSTNGGSTWVSSGYKYSYRFDGSGGATGCSGQEAGTSFLISDVIATGAGDSSNATVRLYNPLSATFNKFVRSEAMTKAASDSHWYSTMMTGALVNTSAMTAARFILSSGNITSGTIRCYGLRN